MHRGFFELYDMVFDEKGNIKACGREICKKLIEVSRNIDDKVDFGNLDTGFMNVENIKNLYKNLKNNI